MDEACDFNHEPLFFMCFGGSSNKTGEVMVQFNVELRETAPKELMGAQGEA